MVEVKAIISPFKLRDVLDALHVAKHISNVTVSDCRSIEVETGSWQDTLKTRIEIMVADDAADEVASLVYRAAHQGSPCDGRVFLIPITDTIEIRSGIHGDATLDRAV